MNPIIIRQFEQISSGGYLVLLRKLKRLVFLLLRTPLYFLALFLVFLIRLFSPIAVVRLGMLDIGRIGASVHGDWYLSQKADGMHLGRYLDFFYFVESTNHVNQQWMKMWKCALPTLAGAELWKNVQRLNRLFPGYQKYQMPDTYIYPAMKEWEPKTIDKISGKFYKDDKLLTAVIKNKKPNISFNNEEQNRGRRLLEELKISNDKDYICFHARDATFLDSAAPTKDWSYHNYRDSSIHNYLPAVEKMTDFGYYGVRMGSLVKERINTSNPLIIDYSSNGMRTDFNDIYIGGHCRFFICSDVGISIIPEIFRIPVIYTNWTQIGNLVSRSYIISGLVIFKKFYLKKEKRFMDFSEIMNHEFGGVNTKNIFEKLQLELIENTPEEICAVTTEMHKRLNDTWVTTEEDEELQKCFWALCAPDMLKSPDLHIGAEYLRDNQELLK